MTVQANWHISDLVLPDLDPMAEIEQLKSGATPLDLAGDEATLNEELRRLVEKESRFAEYAGVSCDLKWAPGHVLVGGATNTCFACPEYTEDPDNARSRICALGRRQEGVLAGLKALDEHATLDEELAAAFMRDIEACGELGELLVA